MNEMPPRVHTKKHDQYDPYFGKAKKKS
jgi:hypothetical protein